MSATIVNYAARTLRLRMPRVCIALANANPAQMVDQAEDLARENSLFEFRLDSQENPTAALPRIKRLLQLRPDLIVIATCRRKAAGGNFSGSIAEELEVLSKAVAAGAHAIDVELETAEEMGREEFDNLRASSATILSYHDFKTTRQLDETFERMKVFAADFYKIATTANCLYDNLEMMKFLQKTSDNYPVVGMCMGEQGIISRVLGLRAGSIFTFASAGLGEETAPGQVSFRELRDLYRVGQVDAVTKIYGVAGDPVEHSLSPLLFNTAFRRESVNAVYLPLHAKKFDDLLKCLHDIPLSGMSVTMPYKQDIIERLDNADQLTRSIGACNTVVRGKDGRLFGFNTDVQGIVEPLASRLPLKDARVLVVGAGGAARAAVFGLKSRGAEVTVVNRTPSAAQALAEQAKAKFIKRAELAKAQFDVIINATPLGMGSNHQSPLEEKELNARIVFDLVYNPLETPLLKLAAKKGIVVISGWEMFLHQAVRQFEIWTGKPSPVESMRQVLLRHLGASEPASVGRAAGAVAEETGEAQTPDLKKPEEPVQHVSTEKPAAKASTKSAKAAEAPHRSPVHSAKKTAGKTVLKSVSKSSAKPAASHGKAKAPAKKAAAKAKKR